MTSEEISNIEEEGFDSKKASGEFGFIAQKDDGSFNIILNKDKPMVGTAAHEFMHAVLFKTIGANKDIQDTMGDALIDHVSNIKGDKSVLGKRLSAYGKFNKDGVFVRSKNFGEEVVTIMSESIVDGSLKFEENVFTKIGDGIRRLFQKIAPNTALGRIKFDTGRDVYNFVKDYSKSIKEGKVNKAILNVAKEGAKGKLVEGKVEAKPTVQMSKDASNNVQRVYEEQGEAGAMDIIEEFKPITSRIAERRREAPGFDKELLMSEIEIGERGILDLIREYKPESGVPLAAYINKFLPSRAIEASKRVLGEEFVEDISEKVDIAAEEVTLEIKAKPKKRKIILSDRLGVKNKVDKAIKKKLPKLDIENLDFKTLKDQTPKVTGEMFGIAPKKLKTLANITKKELQSAQMFINKNADVLTVMLPEGTTTGGTATGVPRTLINAFYTKTGRAKMAKTGTKAGLAIQIKKPNIDKKQFLEVFGIIDGKPVRTDRNTSARVLALASLTGKMMTNQAVREQLMKDNTPLMTNNITRISDGRSSVMFSRAVPSKQDVVFGGINALLSPEQQVVFHEDLPNLVRNIIGINERAMTEDQKNELLLDTVIDKELLQISLEVTYENIIDSKTLGKVADQIDKIVSKLKVKKKAKNIVKQDKVYKAIIKSTEAAQVKIAKFTGVDTTAVKAQDSLVKQEQRRKSDSILFVRKFKKNKEQAIADLIMLGGHSHTSSIIGKGRGQFYKNVRDYYNTLLKSVKIDPVFKRFTRC